MALTANESNIFKLVAGLFNGAPGKNIQTDLSNIVAAGTSLSDLANILVGTLEFQSIVPTGQAAQADFLLKNFGFDPAATDEATTVAKAFVNDNFGLGLGQLAYLAVEFLNTTTDPVFADAAALLNNKALVAGVHAENVDAIAGVAAGQAAFVGVTASGPTTAEAALALLEDNGVVVPDPGQPGQTFVLTTGVDIFNTNNADNDTIVGVLNGANDTLSIGDIIDGGTGTDTLRIATADDAVDTGVATITNVETLNIVNGAAALATIDADSDGYTSLSLDKSNAALTISGVGASTAISIADAGALLNTITYDDVTGAADSATVTIGKAAGAGISMAGIETVNVNLTGKAVLSGANDFSDATAINITNADTSTLSLGVTGTKAAVNVAGAGVLTLGTLDEHIDKVDASASTGGITAILDAAQTSVKGGSGVDTITVAAPTTSVNVSTGAGDDTVDVSALVLTTAGTLDGTNEVIDGGDGTDTLVTDEADLTAANVVANINKAANFEVLSASLAVTGFAADGFTGINNFTFGADNTAGVGNDRTYTLESADSLTLTNSNSGNAMTLNPVLDSGADVVNLTLAASTVNMTQNSIIASQAETINIVSSDTDAAVAHTNTIAALTVQNNTKINVSGAADLTFATLTGTELTIDGSAATGKLGVTAGAGNDTITGGSAADTLVGGAGVDTINGGAGADVITGGLGADRLTGGDGADIFVVSTLAAATDSTDSAADAISDWNTGGNDILRFAAAENVAGTAATAPVAALSVQIDAGGKATFASADNTLALKLVALATDNTNIGNNEVVFFEDSGNTYVYGAGADTANAADDFLITLTGVTSLTTLAESTTAAGDFSLI